jgi:tetrahydromethanopterin S-methyltransferase subunit G
MTRLLAAVLVTSFVSLAGPARAVAQAPPAASVFQDTANARETRDRLHQLLRQYPPALGEVLQRDPSLLNRPDYLAPYPALVAFLAKHPEIARNPSFFFGEYAFTERDPRDRAIGLFHDLLEGLVIGAVFFAVTSVLMWLVRAVIDHRRWLRLSRVQTEVHTKLMDRLTTNEDLLTYIQSPAGRRFLESAPIALDGEPRPTGAPVGRMLWSLQAGIVLVALGIGFWFARQNVILEVAEGFYVLGVIAIALGLGFVVSAVASYFISARLGLLAVKKPVDADA